MTQSRRIAALDTIILILAVAALVIADTGGWVWRSGGRRYSIQEYWRPLVASGVFFAIRIGLFRLAGPFGRPWRAIPAWLGLTADAATAPSARVPSGREQWLVIGSLVVVTAIVLHGQIVNLYLVPDLGDPLFSMWRLAWVTHQIFADPRHLFDANIFYPATATLTFSDSMILPALVAAPFLLAGVHPAVLYTLMFLAAFVLSGWTAYLLARAMGLDAGPSWVGALIFGLYPYRIDHYSHLELQFALWAPLVLLTIHRVLLTGRSRYAVLLAAAVAAQWYSSMYYGLFLMAYAAAFTGILALAWLPGWRRVGLAGAGLALGLALALPLARVYSASAPSRGSRPVDAITSLSADPSDYLQPTARSATYRNWSMYGRHPERDLFPGLVPIVLGLAGAVPPLTPARAAVLVAGLVAFDGSRGLKGHWYPIAHEYLSPLESMRVPARFAIFVGLSLALLSAFGVQRLWGRLRSASSRRALVGGLTLAVMIDVWPTLKLVPVWKTAPSLYASLGPESGAVLFEYPFHPHPDWFAENLRYMYFSIWHWTRMVNGYSGFSPLSYWTQVESTAGFPGGTTVAYLQGTGVTHVTVHCAGWDPAACAQVLAQLDADSRFQLVTRTRWEGAESRLYRLQR